MASGSDGSGKKDRLQSLRELSQAVGPAVTFSGGALVGAVILFGAKKLYDYMKGPVAPPPEEKEKPPEEENLASPEVGQMPDIVLEVTPEEVPLLNEGVSTDIPETIIPDFETNVDEVKPSDDGDSCKKQDHSPNLVITPPTPEKEGQTIDLREYNHELHQKLVKYYEEFVEIDGDNLVIAFKIVEDIKHLFRQYFDELLPNHPVKNLRTFGSSEEGLQAVIANQFSVAVPLVLDPELWELKDAGQTVMGAHGYWLIRRRNLQFFSPGTSRYDKYMVGEYLAPLKIKAAFQDMTNRVGKWGSDYKVQAAVVGTDIQLTVSYGDNTLRVDFIPEVTLDGVTVMAQSHPLVEHNDPSHANLWQQSFERMEIERLIQAPDQGCHMICLKILKAISRKHPHQMGLLPSYVYKQHLLQELDIHEDWSMEILADRFVSLLQTFQARLNEHRLPHYSCPNQNVMTFYDPDMLDFMATFIAKVISEDEYDWLLKTD